MLQLEHLCYQYQEQHFAFSFQVNAGDIVAILGSSGAGKSTLLNLISGILQPTQGEIYWQQETFTTHAAHLRPLSILFQAHNLFSHLNAFDNIALGIKPNLKLDASDVAHIHHIGTRLEIEHLFKRLPCELSGGQQQRVALARALIRQRPILLLDEPFSALDPLLRQQMLTEVKRQARAEKITVLMVTHQIEDARAIADQVLILEQGQVQQYLSIQHFIDNQKTT